MAVFLLAVFPLVLALWLYMSMRPPSRRYPPGPPRWPIIGNMFFGFSMKDHWSVQFQNLAKIYGKIYSFKFGQYDYVVLMDPVDIRAIMHKDEASGRPRLYYVDHIMKFQNAGILMSHGERWKEQRRFCLRHLRDYGFGKTASEDIVMEQFKELVTKIRPEDVSANEPFVISLDKSLNAATANVIWWMMANKRVTANDESFDKMTKSLEQTLSVNLLSLLSFMPTVLSWCPGWVYGESQLRKTRDAVYDYMTSVIEQHDQTLNESEPRDLIDSFLIERRAREKSGTKDTHFTDTMLIMTLLDLFNAGHETTATTLRWFFLYMIQHPTVQEKIHEEIDQVLGREREPRWADYSSMPYTVASINEVWRMANVVPNGADHAAEKTFEYGGYVFPKGTLFLGVLYHVHMDPAIWGDPENFRPERFIDANGKFQKNDNLMPFQVGKRQCMGESLARMVTFLGAAYLLQLFRFEKVDGETYSMEANVGHSPVISTSFPYKVRVVPRSS